MTLSVSKERCKRSVTPYMNFKLAKKNLRHKIIERVCGIEGWNSTVVERIKDIHYGLAKTGLAVTLDQAVTTGLQPQGYH